MWKWVGGIVGAVITAVLTWWLTEGIRSRPAPPPINPASAARETALPKPRMGPLQHGWNYPHNDISADGWLSIGSAEACSDLCYARPDCKAMTYVISNKSCWLKYAVPDRTQNGDMISAAKQESN